jgi:hypothetical protein
MNPRLDKGQIEAVDLRVAEVLRRKSSAEEGVESGGRLSEIT